MSRETSREEEVGRLHRAVNTFGFRCAKLKIGVRNGHDREERDARTYRVVPLARERLQFQTIELSADANGAYSPVGAVRVRRLLESQGYFHFRGASAWGSPCRPDTRPYAAFLYCSTPASNSSGVI
jgi:L-alanine-DL-glutamate epimerase-like enolase superfamily enzyme